MARQRAPAVFAVRVKTSQSITYHPRAKKLDTVQEPVQLYPRLQASHASLPPPSSPLRCSDLKNPPLLLLHAEVWRVLFSIHI